MIYISYVMQNKYKKMHSLQFFVWQIPEDHKNPTLRGKKLKSQNYFPSLGNSSGNSTSLLHVGQVISLPNTHCLMHWKGATNHIITAQTWYIFDDYGLQLNIRCIKEQKLLYTYPCMKNMSAFQILDFFTTQAIMANDANFFIIPWWLFR